MKPKFCNRMLHIVMLSVLSFVYSCNSDKDIELTVYDFYTDCVLSKDFRHCNKSILSADLQQKIDDMISIEKHNILYYQEKHPDEKPSCLIEGDIFSALYEGANAFEINHIRSTHDTALVVVDLVNNYFKDSVEWSDTVLLVKTQTLWKIDNIRFDSKIKDGSLRIFVDNYLKDTENICQ